LQRAWIKVQSVPILELSAMEMGQSTGHFKGFHQFQLQEFPSAAMQLG
jgi:hypothetical protein